MNQNNAAYAAALAEIEEGRLDKGSWARAFAESGGDESKAKALYIKVRAESINDSQAWPDTQPPVEDVPKKRIEPQTASGKGVPGDKPIEYYETALGQKNLDYYLDKFHGFDNKGPGFHASWNWAAFFFTGFWSLYRKMYVWFFAWWAVGTVLTIYAKVQNSELNQILGTMSGVLWVAFTLYANALYHRKIKARIVSARKANLDAEQVNRRLSSSSGVHTWVAYIFGGLPVVGILAAIALHAYQDSAKRKVAAAPQGQETLSLPARGREIHLVCLLVGPGSKSYQYSFVFDSEKSSLYWVEGTQAFEVIRNTSTDLWGAHQIKFRDFPHDATNFYLNRVTGAAEMTYSQKRSATAVADCKKVQSWGCEDSLVLTENSEIGTCSVLNRTAKGNGDASQ